MTKRKLDEDEGTEEIQLQNFLKTITFELDSLVIKNYKENVYDVFETEDIVEGIAESNKKNYARTPHALSKQRTLQLLRAKLLKHKWGDAVMLLKGIAKFDWKSRRQNVKRCAEIMWRVGSDILFHHPAGLKNKELIDAHRRTMGSYCDAIDHTHVLLEHVFYLIQTQDFSRAKEELAYYKTIDKSIAKKERRQRDVLYWTTTCEGYMGLIEYVFWRLMIANGSDQLSREATADETHKKVADTAVKHFRCVLSEPGTWDIFVVKHTEILLYYNKLSELKQDLNIYSRKHAENSNAHRYFYQCLNSYDEPEDSFADLKITALKRLHVISPSDQLMLELHKLLYNKWMFNKPETFPNESNTTMYVDLLESLEVLMCLLDHPCWNNDSRPWIFLHKSLLTLSELLPENSFEMIISKLWKAAGRNTWWPSYHFTGHQGCKTLTTSVADTIAAKIYVATTFYSSKCKFCEILKTNENP